jgi:hypothetical protein
MGGPGSGVRWDKKSAVEEHRRLDVREINREHEIKPGDWMTVQYEWRGEQLAQEVHFDWTPCNYGGHRPWLICMHCGRRVAVLYLRGKYFACRHCQDLTYQSCQGSDSRFSKFLRNYDGSGAAEDLPFYALKGLSGRIGKERDRLQKKINRRRRGRPLKKVSGGKANPPSR